MPVGAPTFAEGLRWGAEVFHALKSVLKARGAATNGRRRRRLRAESALERERVRGRPGGDREGRLRAGERSGDRARSGRDRVLRRGDGTYDLKGEGRTLIGSRRWSTTGRTGPKRYPIVSIEDGLAEDDWENWSALTSEHRRPRQLVGDDLFVTNTERLARGIEETAGNAILVKLNQIGTLTETLEPIELAHRAGFTPSSPIAAAKPTTRSSPIWPSRRTPARSRPARRPASIASPSTTSSWDRRGTGGDGVYPGSSGETMRGSCRALSSLSGAGGWRRCLLSLSPLRPGPPRTPRSAPSLRRPPRIRRSPASMGSGEVRSTPAAAQQFQRVVAAAGCQESQVALSSRLAFIANGAGNGDGGGHSRRVLVDIKCAIEVRDARPVDANAIVDGNAGQVGLVELLVDLVQSIERERRAPFRHGVDALLVLREHRLPHHGAEIRLGEPVEDPKPAHEHRPWGSARADSR